MKVKKYKTIILPVVLYGCETLCFTLREESRLRVFENRILRRIFGPKRDENGEWRRNFIVCSPNIVTGKPTGMRPLWRPRSRRENNIGIDLEEVGLNVGNWVDSAQDRDYWRALVKAALNLRAP